MKIVSETRETKLMTEESLRVLRVQLSVSKQEVLSSDLEIQEGLREISISNDLIEVIDNYLEAGYKFDNDIIELLEKYGLDEEG